MKELKDYLHLYLGCEMLHKSGAIVTMNCIALKNMLNNRYEMNEYKPILHRLIDMGNEDQNFFGCPDDWFNYLKTMEHQIIHLHSDEFHYLLSKHFDLFGLIESGLAIDATTLKTQNTNQL